MLTRNYMADEALVSSRRKKIKLRAVMNPNSRTLAALLLSAIILSFAAGACAQQITWLNDYAAARAEAKKTGKPIFLAFRCSP